MTKADLRLPGNTLDIAIWSTVEQGLAITAGSLATLRPLLKLVAYRLRLTSKPPRPSDYGLSSPRTPGPGVEGHGHGYSLSSMGRDGILNNLADSKTNSVTVSSKGFTVGLERESKIPKSNVTPVVRNESEEELRSSDTWTDAPSNYKR